MLLTALFCLSLDECSHAPVALWKRREVIVIHLDVSLVVCVMQLQLEAGPWTEEPAKTQMDLHQGDLHADAGTGAPTKGHVILGETSPLSVVQPALREESMRLREDIARQAGVVLCRRDVCLFRCSQDKAVRRLKAGLQWVKATQPDVPPSV